MTHKSNLALFLLYMRLSLRTDMPLLLVSLITWAVAHFVNQPWHAILMLATWLGAAMLCFCIITQVVVYSLVLRRAAKKNEPSA